MCIFFRIQTEVMFWPDGDYALMKPKFGCPRDKPSEWSEGRRYHCGNNKNDISNPFDLFGNYTKLCFDQYFCVHKEIKDLSYIPRYQTFWEPGQYCILRKGGKCPEGKGFHSLYIEICKLNITCKCSPIFSSLSEYLMVAIFSYDDRTTEIKGKTIFII